MIPRTHDFVLVYPSDATACGSYRLIYPGEACKAAGKMVSIQPRPPQIATDMQGNLRSIDVGNATAVVFQRAATASMIPAIQILKDRGVRVVIDMDDSLSQIDPRNPVHKNYDPALNKRFNWIYAAQACEMADLVTVTTPALAEEYGGIVIPNHIPAKHLTYERPNNDVPIITWAGWTEIHPGDLAITSGMIQQVLAETDSKFMAFGDPKIFQDLRIRFKAPNFHESFVPFPDYAKTLSKADIGIVPLKKSDFNSKKSRLKALEMASTGVVPVASPTPDNLMLAELGGCLIADSPSSWYNTVKELVLDKDKRLELSEQVRKVASQFTYEDNWELWHNAWTGKTGE